MSEGNGKLKDIVEVPPWMETLERHKTDTQREMVGAPDTYINTTVASFIETLNKAKTRDQQLTTFVALARGVFGEACVLERYRKEWQR